MIGVAHPVEVAIDQAGQHSAAVEVDQPGALRRQRSDLSAPASRDDRPVANRNRLDGRVVRVDRGNLPVVENKVWRVIYLISGGRSNGCGNNDRSGYQSQHQSYANGTMTSIKHQFNRIHAKLSFLLGADC